MHGIAGFEYALVRVQALVLRQQRGVNVEQAIVEGVDELVAQNAHVSGEHHDLRL